MKAYELLYFVVPSVDDKPKDVAKERVEKAMESINAKIDSVENIGRKALAYEIDGATDGDYTLVNFHSDPAGIAELDRIVRLTVEIQRHMIVKRTDKN